MRNQDSIAVLPWRVVLPPLRHFTRDNKTILTLIKVLLFFLFGLCYTATWPLLMGQTTFGSQLLIIESEVKGLESVHAADLDQEGDLDVLSASREDDKIAWYENLGNK